MTTRIWLLIADIHSNLEALEAVLKDAKKFKYEKILCLGDIIGYAASPNEVIDLLRKEKAICTMGNHEAALCGTAGIEFSVGHAQLPIEWTKNVLTKANLKFLCELPKFFSMGDIIAVHGTPRDMLMEYMDLWVAKATLEQVVENLVLCGHSHMPFTYTEGEDEVKHVKGNGKFKFADKRCVISIPSVGQPRDGNNKAGYCIMDFSKGRIEFRRIPYDFKKTAQKITEAGLPGINAVRLGKGL